MKQSQGNAVFGQLGKGLELVSGVWGYSVPGRTGLMGCGAAKK